MMGKEVCLLQSGKDKKTEALAQRERERDEQRGKHNKNIYVLKVNIVIHFKLISI